MAFTLPEPETIGVTFESVRERQDAQECAGTGKTLSSLISNYAGGEISTQYLIGLILYD